MTHDVRPHTSQQSMLLLPCLMMYYIFSVLFSLFVWCPCMAINISVHYNGGLLPGIILLPQCYYHRETRLNAMKRFCICSLRSHLNVLTFFPLAGGCSDGLDAFRFFLTHTHTHQRTQLTIVTNIIEREFVATAIILQYIFTFYVVGHSTRQGIMKRRVSNSNDARRTAAHITTKYVITTMFDDVLHIFCFVFAFCLVSLHGDQC